MKSSALGNRRWRVAGYAAVLLLGVLTVWAVIQVPGESNAKASPRATTSSAARTPQPQAAPKIRPVVQNKCPTAATACVDERLRISWLQHNGKIVYGPVPVMPGTQGADDSVATPKGTFHVQYKDANHVSSEFGEPMQNAVFFAAGGIAFHEGSLTSTSHGCVHLSKKDSAAYFKALKPGAEVAVF